MQPSLVTLICIDCSYEAISTYISEQTYHNLEVLEIIGSELENDIAYLEALNNKTLSGKLLLETSIHDNVNLYGNLSTILLKSEYAKQCKFSFYEVPNSLTKIGILLKN